MKNCVTPHTGKSAGRDKIDLNVQQTNLLKNINLFGEDNFDFYDQCLLPAYDDTERAKRFAFSDQDIDNLLDFKYQLYGGLSPPKRPHSPQFECTYTYFLHFISSSFHEISLSFDTIFFLLQLLARSRLNHRR